MFNLDETSCFINLFALFFFLAYNYYFICIYGYFPQLHNNNKKHIVNSLIIGEYFLIRQKLAVSDCNSDVSLKIIFIIFYNFVIKRIERQ